MPPRLKQLLGSPGYDSASVSAAEPEGGFPPCPRELTGSARKEWLRLRKVMKNLRLITPSDRSAVMAYCIAFGHMVDAHAVVSEKGLFVKTRKGQLLQNPYLAVANHAMAEMRKFISELGLSPTSRGGLRLPGSKAPAAPPDKDDLDDFLEKDPEQEASR